MKGFLVTVFCACFALLTVAPAHAAAAPDVDAIAAALQQSPVYVMEGADGTDADTAPVLERLLNEDDSIVVVMLPQDKFGSSDPDRLAEQIGDRLNDEAVVAVAIGDSYGADAETLRAGVADQLMRNADTVSQNPLDTVGTFIRNVHDWVRTHPEELVTPVTEAAGPDLTLAFILFGISSVMTFGGILFFRRLRRRVPSEVRNNGPREIRPTIAKLMNISKRVKDDDMRKAIEKSCLHTEHFFNRLTTNRKDERLVSQFENYLKKLFEVVEVYQDVAQNPQYFDNPREVLQSGKDSVKSYAEFVLKSIKRNNSRGLTDYTVNTNILSAQRYS